MIVKKWKRNVFNYFKMLTKCINFAAENEHNVKDDLIWVIIKDGPFSIETINKGIYTLLIIKDYEEDWGNYPQV